MDVDLESESDPMIKQGAEGRVYKTKFLGRVAILKERFVKTYRHPELDARLTKERIRAEAKSIVRCKNAGKYLYILILTPSQYSNVDLLQEFALQQYIRWTSQPTELSWNTSTTVKLCPSISTSCQT